MTTDTQDATTSQNTGEGSDNTASEAETLRTELLKVTQERDSAKKKARDFEAAAKQADQWKTQAEQALTEKSNIHAQFQSLQKQVRDKEVNQHLTTALEAAGALNVGGALKLVDTSKIEFGEDGNVKQDSVAAIVNAAKASDPWAFKELEDPSKKGTTSGSTTTGQPPSVKGAAQASTNGAFETELRAAKTPTEVDTVLKKYGKF